MELDHLDHLVLTTQNLKACLHFYVDLLGMKAVEKAGRYALCFGSQKINIHTVKGEFQPAAQYPTYGSLDFCLIAKGDIHTIRQELLDKGAPLITDIVPRNGALGPMDSLYLRDPDGNLVEIAVYR